MTEEELTALAEWLLKASSAIFLATDESVANDMSPKLAKAADAIAELRRERDAWEKRATTGDGVLERTRAKLEAAEARVARLEAALLPFGNDEAVEALKMCAALRRDSSWVGPIYSVEVEFYGRKAVAKFELSDFIRANTALNEVKAPFGWTTDAHGKPMPKRSPWDGGDAALDVKGAG